jgi:hypothetical protein
MTWALPCDGTASAVTFTPAEGLFGRLLFEDTWPKHGDLPVARAAVATLERRVDGGAWAPLSASMADGGLPDQLNSLPTQASLPLVRVEVRVTFAQPTAMDAAAAPYDVFIFRSADPGHELHRTP